MEDEKIIELFLQRNQDAITRTNEKYGAYCHSIAMHILGNRQNSEECVNDTWFKAWGAIPPERPLCLKTYLGRITRNLSLNRLRDMSRQKRGGRAALITEELTDCISDAGVPEKELEDREIIASVNRWLEALPAEHRIAFVRRYWYFDNLPSISARMDWSYSKTNSLLRRLRKGLRQHLESEVL